MFTVANSSAEPRPPNDPPADAPADPPNDPPADPPAEARSPEDRPSDDCPADGSSRKGCSCAFIPSRMDPAGSPRQYRVHRRCKIPLPSTPIRSASTHTPLDPVHHFHYSRDIEKTYAIAALSALAQKSRLDVFRLLVQAGTDGIPAGQIGERLSLPSATLSFHLNHLKQSGVVKCRRDGRPLIYTADQTAMNALLAYLTENCCQGNPAACNQPFVLSNNRIDNAQVRNATQETPARPRRRDRPPQVHPVLQHAVRGPANGHQDRPREMDAR